MDAHIPHEYVPGERLRLEAYRRIASIAEEKDVVAVHDELVDRYGKLPEPVGNLLAVALFRAHARTAGLSEIVLQGNFVKFSRVYLRESQELRLKRVFPGSIVKKQADHILVPRPKTAGFPSGPVTGLPLLEWCRSLIDGVVSMGTAS